MTGDAKPGAIVEARAYEDAAGRKRLLLATAIDLTMEHRLRERATWLDRQLLAPEPATSGGGFGAEVRDAMDRRIDHLSADGLARRQGQRVVFARDLINNLAAAGARCRRRQALDRDCLAHRPSAEGSMSPVSFVSV